MPIFQDGYHFCWHYLSRAWNLSTKYALSVPDAVVDEVAWKTRLKWLGRLYQILLEILCVFSHNMFCVQQHSAWMKIIHVYMQLSWVSFESWSNEEYDMSFWKCSATFMELDLPNSWTDFLRYFLWTLVFTTYRESLYFFDLKERFSQNVYGSSTMQNQNTE